MNANNPTITEFTGEFNPSGGRKPDAVSVMLDAALKTSIETGKPQLWAGSGTNNPKYTRLRQRLTNRASALGYKVSAMSVNGDADMAFKAFPANESESSTSETPATTPTVSATPAQTSGPKKAASSKAS